MFTTIRGCARQLQRPLSSQPWSSARQYSQNVVEKKNIPDLFTERVNPLVFKKYKPVSPGLRHLKRPLSPYLYEGRPVRELTVAKRKTGGRNCTGRITIRHIGGGHRQRIRILDFKREDSHVHDVVRIEYDPGRSSHIALIKSRNPNSTGNEKWSYILATEGMRAGDTVQSFRSGIPADLIPGMNISMLSKTKGKDDSSLSLGMFRAITLKSGNVLPLRLIPPGTLIHNIALKPDGPMILVRSAGAFGQMLLNEEDGVYAHVKMQSGEIRKVLQSCCATIGKVSNMHWKYRELGKAGRNRWLGRRPKVRGMAMNANDHPHGGGRGKSKSNKDPVSIWGWGTKGTRTRKPGPLGPRGSNKMVLSERPRVRKNRRT